ncbi:MAG: hypothetical protein KJ645_08830, partial [Planctomycetes bacterium]|nr:hypothetical protein [Planctomycetota bacterium]
MEVLLNGRRSALIGLLICTLFIGTLSAWEAVDNPQQGNAVVMPPVYARPATNYSPPLDELAGIW